MSWIDTILNILFPPPVSLSAFDTLPPPVPHTYEPWILAATRYQSKAKTIVRYLKETPDTKYAHACARLMSQTLEAFLLEQENFISTDATIYLVPVPQHKSSTKSRGFSQSDVLANELQKLLPYTIVKKCLIKNRKTEKQALLPKHKRLVNQIGSFSFLNVDAHTRDLFVLIDDVSTTGSTLRECRKVLVDNQYKNIIGLVFAH